MILAFSHVTKTAHGRPLLSDISFSQPPHVSIGVLGARGSGKSTLINMLLGAVSPDSGRIQRHGRLSMPIGFPATLNRYLTGEENARYIARLYGLDPKTLCAFVEEFADLGPMFKRRLSSYNASLRSRLVFALSYAIPADCYVADGTIFGGDAAFRDKCLAMAKQRRQEAAFFFTTRSPRDMRLFADVGAVIQNHSLVFYPTVAEAIAAFGQADDDAPALIADLPADDPNLDSLLPDF
jgi:capsular polysaccharide transport system ATP-binding protein